MPSLFAIADSGAPYITVGNLAKNKLLPTPAILPISTTNGCAFSPDGSKLAVAHASSPYITIYNTSDWSKVANPATLPTNAANGCAFSPDGSKLAVAHVSSPFVTIYNTSDWSKVANPAILPTGTGYGCAFSPDGSKLAVAHANSPFITIYNTSDWSKTELPHHAVSQGRAVAFVSVGGLTLRGEVRDINGYVASRRVRVYERATGELCAETVSSPVDGAYEVQVYEGNVPYDVQFMADDLENLNDLFYARSVAGMP